MEQYVIRGGQAGFDRLRTLAALRLPDTSRLFDRVGVRPGWRCADLGCGSGDITAEIGRRVGPHGTVTGVDMDPVKVERANATHRLANISFVVADLQTWSEPAGFDLVYCGLVLQHLPDPASMIRRMWEAIRPGGVLVVEDADFDGLFCYPPSAAFDFYAEQYREVLRRRGGDPAIGRKLCRLFLDADIPAPELSLVQRADLRHDDGKGMALSTLVATGEAILSEGLASRDELDRAVAALADYTATPSTVVGDPRIFQVWARAPGGRSHMYLR